MPQPIVQISASQLSTFKACPRKWAFDKIDNVPRPDTAATNEGKAIHAEVEAWFRDGTPCQTPAALALLAHLPQRDPALQVEQPFDFVWPWLEDVRCHGFIDLIDPRTDTVYDHKTVGDLKRFPKTAEDLRNDAQVTLYGLAYRTMHPSTATVALQWTYVQRKHRLGQSPPTDPVRLSQSITALETALGVWRPVAEELVQIRRSHTRAADVRADPSACYQYGPCPHRDSCVDFAGTRRAAPQEPTPMLSPEARARLKAASQAPVPPTPPPESAVSTITPASAPTPANQPPPMSRLAALSEALNVVAPAIVPPDAQPNVSPAEPPPPPLEPVKRGRKPKAATPPAAAPKAAPAPVDLAPADDTAFDLESFINQAIQRASREDDAVLQLEAARIAVDFLKVKAGQA